MAFVFSCPSCSAHCDSPTRLTCGVVIGLPFLVPDLPDTYCRVLYGLPSTADSSQGEAGCCDVCRRTPCSLVRTPNPNPNPKLAVATSVCSLVRTPDQTQQPRLLFVRALSLERQPWDLGLGPIVYYTTGTVLVVLLFCSRRYLCWSLCFDFFSLSSPNSRKRLLDYRHLLGRSNPNRYSYERVRT